MTPEGDKPNGFGVRWSPRIELGQVMQALVLLGAVISGVAAVVWVEAGKDAQIVLLEQRVKNSEAWITATQNELRDTRLEAREGLKALTLTVQASLDRISATLADLRVTVAGPNRDGRR